MKWREKIKQKYIILKTHCHTMCHVLNIKFGRIFILEASSTKFHYRQHYNEISLFHLNKVRTLCIILVETFVLWIVIILHHLIWNHVGNLCTIIFQNARPISKLLFNTTKKGPRGVFFKRRSKSAIYSSKSPNENFFTFLHF